jgi:hypothetical protein
MNEEINYNSHEGMNQRYKQSMGYLNQVIES